MLERERGLRAEDSWYVVRDQPRRVERPDYGEDRPEDSGDARGGKGSSAEDGGWEVPRDPRVPLVIWDFGSGEDVNLEDLAWDRRLEGWKRRELGRWGRAGAMARRFHGVSDLPQGLQTFAVHWHCALPFGLGPLL